MAATIAKAMLMKHGSSIKNQLPIDHVSIGAALGWNARTAIMAIDSNTPEIGKHPHEIDVLLLFLSIEILYSLRILANGLFGNYKCNFSL